MGRMASITAAAALIVVAGGATDLEPEARDIAEAFRGHGMAEAKSRCWGRTLHAELGEDSGEAARIVREADTQEEIRENVRDGGIFMVEAFLSAKTHCGE